MKDSKPEELEKAAPSREKAIEVASGDTKLNTITIEKKSLCLCTLLLFMALFGIIFISSKLYTSFAKQELCHPGNDLDSSAIKDHLKKLVSQKTSPSVKIKEDITSPKTYSTSIPKTSSMLSADRTSSSPSTSGKTYYNSAKENTLTQITQPSTIHLPIMITKSTSEKLSEYSMTDDSVIRHTSQTIETTKNDELAKQDFSEISIPKITWSTEEFIEDATESSINMVSSLSELHLSETLNKLDHPTVSSLNHQSLTDAIIDLPSRVITYSTDLTTDDQSNSDSELPTTYKESEESSTENNIYLNITSESTTYGQENYSVEASSEIMPKETFNTTIGPTLVLAYTTESKVVTSSESTSEVPKSTATITTEMTKEELENTKNPVPSTTKESFTIVASKIEFTTKNNSTTALIGNASSSVTTEKSVDDGLIVFEDELELLRSSVKNNSKSFTKTKNKIFENKKVTDLISEDLRMLPIETTLSGSTTTTTNCSNYCVVPTCPACEVTPCPDTPSTLQPETSSKPVELKVCKTSQCQVMAGRILSLVNISFDPCEDFYSYSCGGILNNPTLLEEDPASDVWNRIERAVFNVSTLSPASHQKFKNYYEGCVKYDTLASLDSRRKQGLSVLNSVGQFLEPSSSSEEEFVELLIKLFKLGSAPLFNLQLDVDSVNSSRFQLVISPPDWLSSYFLTPEEKSERCRHKADDSIPVNTQEAFAAYETCMRNVSDFLDTTEKALKFFQVFDLPAYNASQLIQEIRMFMELELFELILKFPSRGDIEKDKQFKNYKLWSKIKLDSEMPFISWSYLFSSLLNVEIEDATNVQVYFSDHIVELVKELSTKNARSVQNSLMAVLAHDLYTELVVTHHSCDRGRYCLRVAASLMPSVASNLYLSTFSSHHINQTRKQAVQIYTQFVSEMEEQLKTASWLDANSMSRVDNKLKFMAIQFPPILSDLQLDHSVRECSLNEMQFLKDSACLVKQSQGLKYSLYTLDPHFEHAMWPHFLMSFSTQTKFVYSLNTYLVPQTVLTEFDSQMPQHVIMARLGFILAQGIAHNFDKTGVKYTAGGKFGQMLSEHSYKWYQDVVDINSDLFSFMRSHKEGRLTYEYLLDPELSLNQRLSDITAANLAQTRAARQLSNDYKLLWVPFSQSQLFYITLAQSFCSKKKMPEMYTHLYEGTYLLPFVRVFNAFSSSEQFALAFQCPQGAPMNLQDAMKTRPFPIFPTEKMDYD